MASDTPPGNAACGATLPDPITPSHVHVCRRTDDHGRSPKDQHWDFLTDMTWPVAPSTSAARLTVMQAHLAADCPDRATCWAKDIHDAHESALCCRERPEGGLDGPCTWPETDCYQNGPAMPTTAASRALAWLRLKVGHHLARACWKFYDLALHIEHAGNRLNHWAYR